MFIVTHTCRFIFISTHIRHGPLLSLSSQQHSYCSKETDRAHGELQQTSSLHWIHFESWRGNYSQGRLVVWSDFWEENNDNKTNKIWINYKTNVEGRFQIMRRFKFLSIQYLSFGDFWEDPVIVHMRHPWGKLLKQILRDNYSQNGFIFLDQIPSYNCEGRFFQFRMSHWTNSSFSFL